MFWYTVKICKGQEELAQQQMEIKDFLQDVFRDYQGTDTAPLRTVLREKMLEMFEYPENFLVSVDSMWRSDTPSKVSFFINLMVRCDARDQHLETKLVKITQFLLQMKTKQMEKKKSVILFAEYKELTTLKETAAYQVFKFNLHNLPGLYLPQTIQAEIQRFL